MLRSKLAVKQHRSRSVCSRSWLAFERLEHRFAMDGSLLSDGTLAGCMPTEAPTEPPLVASELRLVDFLAAKNQELVETHLEILSGIGSDLWTMDGSLSGKASFSQVDDDNELEAEGEGPGPIDFVNSRPLNASRPIATVFDPSFHQDHGPIFGPVDPASVQGNNHSFASPSSAKEPLALPAVNLPSTSLMTEAMQVYSRESSQALDSSSSVHSSPSDRSAGDSKAVFEFTTDFASSPYVTESHREDSSGAGIAFRKASPSLMWESSTISSLDMGQQAREFYPSTTAFEVNGDRAPVALASWSTSSSNSIQGYDVGRRKWSTNSEYWRSVKTESRGRREHNWALVIEASEHSKFAIRNRSQSIAAEPSQTGLAMGREMVMAAWRQSDSSVGNSIWQSGPGLESHSPGEAGPSLEAGAELLDNGQVVSSAYAPGLILVVCGAVWLTSTRRKRNRDDSTERSSTERSSTK